MLGFLLFISFIAHAAAFYWIFQLKKRLNEAAEVENVLAVYIEEMKEQNDEMIHFLKDFQTEPPSVEKEGPLSSDEEVKRDSAEGPYSPLPPDESRKEDRFETSMEAQVLALADQGMNHEEIAKKLGRGKGEVALLLRLAKNEGTEAAE
ncbi:MAG TPA: helix-turn-helix domain-containing protein [Bacillales bacterium]|nr:helix-turn-helix domain-containing protein [Bacillales bacterium]